MGLTKRKDSFYVEFPVLDDGKTLTLARGVAGAKLKRWRVGCLNKEIAKNQEALIKADLLKGTIKSERQTGPLAFKALVDGYLNDPFIKAQAIYVKKKRWLEEHYLPRFGANTAIDAISTDHIEAYLEDRRKDNGYQGTKLKVATINREIATLKHLFN